MKNARCISMYENQIIFRHGVLVSWIEEGLSKNTVNEGYYTTKTLDTDFTWSVTAPVAL